MKDIKWLIHRLNSMNIQELLWRVQQKVLQKKEYRKYYALHVPVTEIPLKKEFKALKADAAGIPLNLNNYNTSVFETLDIFKQFDYRKYKKKWNAGFQTNNSWPEKEFSYHIAIGQREDIGDIRTNWELNRHYQFACLAKNFYLSGNEAYLHELTVLFHDWNTHNCFLHGAEWTSAMEIAIRSLSWIYTYAFLYYAFEKYGIEKQELPEQICHGLVAMADHIVNHRARFSSANNHLIVEIFAVGMVGILFHNKEWIDLSIKILTDELPKQNCEDGVNKEMSLHYQSFVMEAYGIFWLTLKKNNIDVPESWRKYLTSMSRFVSDCCGEYGEVLVFGDNDEGKLLDLQGKISDHYRYVLQLMGVLLEQRYTDEPLIENVCWLISERQKEEYMKKNLYQPGTVSFYKEGGYTILRSRDHKVLIGMDHAELGFGSIAAHGHADALSIQLFYCGQPVLVDSGTFNYHVPKHLRNEFRSTKAHNTVYMEGVEQAEMLGPFLWGKRFKVENVTADVNENCAKIVAAIVFSGVTHTRKMLFDYDRTLAVEDSITGSDKAYQIWHLPPEAKINENEIELDDIRIEMISETELVKKESLYSEMYGVSMSNYALKIDSKLNRISVKFKIGENRGENNEL